MKAFYVKANHPNFGKPAPQQSVVTRDGTFYGGNDAAPDSDFSGTVFANNPQLYQTVTDAMERTRFFGATAYYLNHAANAAYAQTSANEGFLSRPTKVSSICLVCSSRQSMTLSVQRT